MNTDPAVLGAIAGGAGSALWFGFVRVTRHRHEPGPHLLAELVRAGETYLRAQAEATTERERRRTLVALVLVLRPGMVLIDERGAGRRTTVKGEAAAASPRAAPARPLESGDDGRP